MMEEEKKEQNSLKKKIENADSFSEMKDAVVDNAKDKIKAIKPFNKIKIIAGLVVGVFLFGCVAFTLKSCSSSGKEEINISQSIESINLIDELGSCVFPYNGMTELLNKKGKLETYITYEGEVTLGIKNFSKIGITVDDEAKTINVDLPPIVVLKTNVISDKVDSLDETKKELPELKRVAEEDLKNVFNEQNSDNKYMYDCAENTIKETLKILLDPVLKISDEQYTIVYK